MRDIVASYHYDGSDSEDDAGNLWEWLYPCLFAMWMYGRDYGDPELMRKVESHPNFPDPWHDPYYHTYRWLTPADYGDLTENIYEQLVYIRSTP